MAGKKTKVKLQGTNTEVDGTELQVTESTERWSEVNLEDGTILRVENDHTFCRAGRRTIRS